MHAKGQISLAAAVVAPGLMVTAIILLMGAVSGAHLNPAVSLAFAYALRGRGGDVISRAAGSGVLDEGALTAKAQLSQDIGQGKVIPPASPTPMRSRPGNDRRRAQELGR